MYELLTSTPPNRIETKPTLAHLSQRRASTSSSPHQAPKLRGALERIGDWTVEIVKRSDATKGFEVAPRRCVVERTFAWLGRCRRSAKEWDKSIASADAWINVAQIRLIRRVAKFLAFTMP